MDLLSAGADPNYANAKGRTPLMVAAERGQLRVTDLLLAAELGADANARDAEGWTPLILAARNGHARLVAALVAANAKTSDASRRQLPAGAHSMRAHTRLKPAYGPQQQQQARALCPCLHQNGHRDGAADASFLRFSRRGVG